MNVGETGALHILERKMNFFQAQWGGGVQRRLSTAAVEQKVKGQLVRKSSRNVDADEEKNFHGVEDKSAYLFKH